MANFMYVNRNLRVDKDHSEGKEKTKSGKYITWVKHTSSLWDNQENWDSLKGYIINNCKGTTEGAQLIEKVINILGKYAGTINIENLTPNEQDSLGLNQEMMTNLLSSLRQINLGSSGTAVSLIGYYASGEGVYTAQNAGFSFETRISEFFQRLSGKTKFKNDEIKAFRTGAQQVGIGSDLKPIILGDAAQIFEFYTDEFGKRIRKAVDKANIDAQKVVVFGYTVPDKADITVPTNINIHGDYGPEIEKFLNAIKGKRFSLKNTSELNITLDSTKDFTRLRAFTDLFLKGKYNASGVGSFVFASKRSPNPKVSLYLDWARILYSLMGAGQYSRNETNNDYLLVDYLVINSYSNILGVANNGQTRVFSMKELLPLDLPNTPYDPPFKIYNKGEEYHGGEVKLNLASLPRSFSFSR